MNSTLDDIFKRILQSEKEVIENREKLMSVKEEIRKTGEKIKEEEEKCISFRAQELIQREKLCETEISLQWLKTQSRLLEENQAALMKQKEETERELYAIEEKIKNIREAFCVESEEFCKMYNVSESGKLRREQEIQRKIKELLQEDHNLQKELKWYRDHQQVVEKYENQIKTLESEIESYDTEIKKFTRQLQAKEQLFQERIKMKEDLLKAPWNDPEFQRIRDEIQCTEKLLSNKQKFNMQGDEFQSLKEK